MSDVRLGVAPHRTKEVIAPVILGGDKHLFEDFKTSLDLENRGVRQSRRATFIEFAVKR